MSYSRGRAALRLESTAEIPHTQYITHPKFMDAIGDKLDLDFIWVTDSPDLKGRLTSMGHAEWMEHGEDYNPETSCPFATPEDVFALDPVAEYGLPDINAQAEKYQAWWKKEQAETDAPVPGGLYRSVVSFAIAAFGWEMFLLAVGTDEERFDKVMEGWFKVLMTYIQAWCKTDIEFFLTHDDMVWTQGAIFRPDWYRRYVFPRYQKYWEELRHAGKKVLFCSDGNFTEFVDDIAAAGAQGFIFEPLTSLEEIVAKYGKTHVIMGNADTRILTFGTKEDVQKEVKRCMDLGRDCPGYFFAVGNHIPPNVPLENAMACMEAYWEMRKR